VVAGEEAGAAPMVNSVGPLTAKWFAVTPGSIMASNPAWTEEVDGGKPAGEIGSPAPKGKGCPVGPDSGLEFVNGEDGLNVEGLFGVELFWG